MLARCSRQQQARDDTHVCVAMAQGCPRVPVSCALTSHHRLGDARYLAQQLPAAKALYRQALELRQLCCGPLTCGQAGPQQQLELAASLVKVADVCKVGGFFGVGVDLCGGCMLWDRDSTAAASPIALPRLLMPLLSSHVEEELMRGLVCCVTPCSPCLLQALGECSEAEQALQRAHGVCCEVQALGTAGQDLPPHVSRKLQMLLGLLQAQGAGAAQGAAAATGGDA